MSALIVFIQKAIAQGIGMLFGATGEIITEKSGNLNLGVPGLMYMGGIAGLMGAFIYESGAENPSGIVGVLISMLCALLASGFGALIYSVLTITLRANQNVTGLALTTFGVGFGNFFGGSLSQLAGGFRCCDRRYLPYQNSGIIQDPCYRRCFIFLWFYDLFRHYTGNPCFMVYV